jgi:hypothetical protein
MLWWIIQVRTLIFGGIIVVLLSCFQFLFLFRWYLLLPISVSSRFPYAYVWMSIFFLRSNDISTFGFKLMEVLIRLACEVTCDSNPWMHYCTESGCAIFWIIWAWQSFTFWCTSFSKLYSSFFCSNYILWVFKFKVLFKKFTNVIYFFVVISLF